MVNALGYDGLEYSDPTIWSQMKIFGGAGTDKGGSSGGTNPPDGTDPEAVSSTYTGWVYLYR